MNVAVGAVGSVHVAEPLAPVAEVRRHHEQVGRVGQVGRQQPAVERLLVGRQGAHQDRHDGELAAETEDKQTDTGVTLNWPRKLGTDRHDTALVSGHTLNWSRKLGTDRHDMTPVTLLLLYRYSLVRGKIWTPECVFLQNIF